MGQPQWIAPTNHFGGINEIETTNFLINYWATIESLCTGWILHQRELRRIHDPSPRRWNNRQYHHALTGIASKRAGLFSTPRRA